MVARHMVEYGSPLVAGVTPGKQGECVAGVPVYDSVPRALEDSEAVIDTTLVSVPPLAVLTAGREALAAGLRRLVIATENVPRHDVVRLLAEARDVGAEVIGPNSVGAITPSKRRKIGAIGGSSPERAFVPGNIGIVSRSGGMTSEVGLTLRRAGLGVSTAISIGGDELIGMPTAAAVALLQVDEATDVVCVFGEPGTTFEEDLAEAIALGSITVPVVALIAGLFTEALPEGTAFGHAAAIIADGAGKPSVKRRLLAESGAEVVSTLDELVVAVRSLLPNR
jgi:succinyl-CoA synthetase alpha subunit